MPPQAMGPGDEAYAVVAAIPLDSPGITLIFAVRPTRRRKVEGSIDAGNVEFGMVGGEAPGRLRRRVRPLGAGVHVRRGGLLRDAGGALRDPASPETTGAARGVSWTSWWAPRPGGPVPGDAECLHIKDKLVEMTQPGRDGILGLGGMLGHGLPDEERRLLPDRCSPTCTKYNVTKHIYETARLAHDVAGGILATLPFGADLRHPEIGKTRGEKYMKGIEGVSTETRILRCCACSRT